MDPVYETFDEPELDEASDVDVIEDGEILVEVEFYPFLRNC